MRTWRCGLLLCGVVAVSSLSLPSYDVSPNLSAADFYEDVSLLETSTSDYSLKKCSSYGDTHVSSLSDIGFNVMGQREWVLVEGPTNDLVPKFFVQATQMIWQNCGRANEHITILEDVAVQCGDAMFLLDQPHLGASCRGVYGDNYAANPRLFVHGKYASSSTYLDGSQDMVGHVDFREGKRVRFDAGNGGVLEIYMEKNYCADKRCTMTRVVDQYVKIHAYCESIDTHVNSRCCWDGGRFSEVEVSVPTQTSTARIRTGSSSNLEGGYCQGWSTTATNALNAQHKTCREMSPQGFYSKSEPPPACVAKFTTTLQNSVFAKFEGWTKGSYDSKWAKEEARSMATAEDMDRFRELCTSLLSRFTNKLSYKTVPTNSWEVAAKTAIDACAEDMGAGMTWDLNEMGNHICGIAGQHVQEERKDIFCAAMRFNGQCAGLRPTSMTDILADAKSDADIKRLRDNLQTSRALSTEVSDSADNIAFWNIDECTTRIAATPNLDNTDCKDHTFIDTAKNTVDPNSKTKIGRVTNANHEGEMVSSDSIFNPQKAVVFVGTPSFSGSNPVAPRIKTEVDGWRIFVAEPKCWNEVHVKETIPYMIFDSEAGTPDFTIVTTKVSGVWKDVVYPPMEGEILAFASIQSTNNNACAQLCGTRGGVRGYVTTRIKNIGKSKLSISLFADSNTAAGTLQEEDVAIILVTKRSGVIGTKKWVTGTFETATTTASNRNKPSTSFSVPVEGLTAAPYLFLQAITFSDPKPMSLRTVSTTSSRLVFAVDSDNCDSKPRTHGKETVAYLALEL